MRYAIVSDIHANMQAWDAVLNDSRIMRCEVILCLGDIVGYGPKPAEVLESVCTYAASIVVGDHDAAIGGHLESSVFSDDAREVIEWTRPRLSAVTARLFADMEGYLQGEGFVICHSEMDLPERFTYIREPEQTRPSFEATDSPLIFAGHTHEPGVFTLDPTTGAITQSKPLEVILEPEKRYFVNVGSVGHPLHGDTLSAYAIYDSEARRITFRGVPFDLDAYAAAVLASGLPVRPPFLPETAARPAMRPSAARPRVMQDTDKEAAIQVPVVNPHRRSGPIRYVTPEELRDTSRTVRLKKYDSPLLRRDDPVTPPTDTRQVAETPEETGPQETVTANVSPESRNKRKPIIIRKRSDVPPKPKILETPALPIVPEPEPTPVKATSPAKPAKKPKPEKRGLFGFGKKKPDKKEAIDAGGTDSPEPDAAPTTEPKETPVVVRVEDEAREQTPSPAVKEDGKDSPPETGDQDAADGEGVSEDEKEKLRKERAQKILLAAQKRKQTEQARKSAYQNKLRESLKARQEAALKKRKEAEASDAPADGDEKGPENT